jgi:hypothetical protein
MKLILAGMECILESLAASEKSFQYIDKSFIRKMTGVSWSLTRSGQRKKPQVMLEPPIIKWKS